MDQTKQMRRENLGGRGRRLARFVTAAPTQIPPHQVNFDGLFLYNESREFNKTSTQESHKHQILVAEIF
jgi:hypothetical protein